MRVNARSSVRSERSEPSTLQGGAAGSDKAMRDMGRAAGLAAAVVAAGVATSALAIDMDLAVTGALVAAGASLLQGGSKAGGRGARPLWTKCSPARSWPPCIGTLVHLLA